MHRRGQGPGIFTESGRRLDSANMQPVAMPCCGTTRWLHDDISGSVPVRRRCTKCGTQWGVTYLGGGKFRFVEWHNKLKRSTKGESPR